jgi:hypothetical protein
MTELFFRRPGKRVRQGDIALCESQQLRARSGELSGPGDEDLANEELPYLGERQIFKIPVVHPGRVKPVERVLHVWLGYVMVLSQSCELEYADPNDSRILVAPIVSRAQWPNGPWELIEAGSLPGFLYLTAMDAEQAQEHGLPAPWPESAVVMASATCSSRGLVTPNRILALDPKVVSELQQALVRFLSVRGWAAASSVELLRGKTVVDVQETTEIVPGPARLTKVVLDDENGGDEVTVVCGVRPTKRKAA